MRQHHVAGEKAFVDYSGKRIGIADPTTGEIREAEIFVGVLGASNLTYAEATWTQTLPDWTGDRALFLKLAACGWIADRRNLLLTGASGLGKSWLACALGHKACRENISVLYMLEDNETRGPERPTLL